MQGNASKYNEWESRELGWQWALPALKRAGALLGFERPLADAIESGASFGIVSGVEALQRELGVEPDGLLGPSTWAAYCRRNRQSVDNGLSYVRIGGCRVPVLVQRGTHISHPPGDRDLLHGGGHREQLRGAVIHWGGVDISSCNAALFARNLSSHLLVEGDLDRSVADGKLSVMQTMDLAKVAWHVGELNRWTIGIDICRSPSLSQRWRYPKAPVLRNTTGRGNAELTGLEADYAQRVSGVIWAIAGVLGIQRTASPGVEEFKPEQVERFKLEGGVVGHCNLSPPSSRWDPAPWMDLLF